MGPVVSTGTIIRYNRLAQSHPDDRAMAPPALKLATRGYMMRGGEVRRSGAIAKIRELALAEEFGVHTVLDDLTQ